MRCMQIVRAGVCAALLSAAVSTALAKSEGPITQGRLDAIGSESKKPLGSCPPKSRATRSFPRSGPEGVDYEGVFGVYAEAVQVPTLAGPAVGNALSGRATGSRGVLLGRYGGTSTSEGTVAKGLKWLAKQQRSDGGWSFSAGSGGGPGSFADPGKSPCRIEATSLALLSLLGAGQTHEGGQYKAAVKGGLDFLGGQMKVSDRGGDLRGNTGSMISHGMATLALCEAYAMTHDNVLKTAAQRAIDFIVASQDKQSGGWTAGPGEPPSSVVTGWQVLALKCAREARLRVPATTITGARQFLLSVQADGGTRYGASSAKDVGPASTAVGLLCHMLLGSKPNDEALKKGITRLGQQGPSETDLLHTWFAQMLMHHHRRRAGESTVWIKWNNAVRDRLVNSQAAEGAEAGSWFDPHEIHAGPGGRLWQTAISLMTLEVYYRHLTIYRVSSN